MKKRAIKQNVLDFATQRNYDVCIAITPSYGVYVSDNKVFFNDCNAFLYEEEGVVVVITKADNVGKYEGYYQMRMSQVTSENIRKLKHKFSSFEERAKRYFAQIKNLKLSDVANSIAIADNFDYFLKNVAKIHRDYKGDIRDFAKTKSLENNDTKVITHRGIEEIPESAFERTLDYLKSQKLSQEELAKALQTKDAYVLFEQCLKDIDV